MCVCVYAAHVFADRAWSSGPLLLLLLVQSGMEQQRAVLEVQERGLRGGAAATEN